MNMIRFMKDKRGISLTALMLTMVVALIVIAITSSQFDLNTSAKTARFNQELSELEKGIDLRRTLNSKGSIKDADKDFCMVYVAGNIPQNFESISSHSNMAYLVSLDKLGYDELHSGNDYKNFEAQNSIVKTVTFGTDDVYVYDKNINVFYIKGYKVDDVTYHQKIETD